MSLSPSCANSPWLEWELSKCVVKRRSVGLKNGPIIAGNRLQVPKIGALTPLFTRVSVSLGVLWSGKRGFRQATSSLVPAVRRYDKSYPLMIHNIPDGVRKS